MKTTSISAMTLALALGIMSPAQAEDWTGLHLTFGLSGASTNLRDEQVFGPKSLSSDDIAPYVAVGYDWAFDSFTLGVVGDVALNGLDSEDFVSQGKGLYGDTDWFASLRGRVGVPVSDQVHVFASGGLGLMRVDATGNDIIVGTLEADSQLLKGAVVGLGAEYALSPGRHLTVEYIYADFERSDLYLEGSLVEGTFSPTFSALRLGYTLRF